MDDTLTREYEALKREDKLCLRERDAHKVEVEPNLKKVENRNAQILLYGSNVMVLTLCFLFALGQRDSHYFLH